VLLAHPTGFHGRVWDAVARILHAAGHRVVAFDFRGHGDSDAPPIDDHDYSWEGFGADVVGLCAHLGLGDGTPTIAAGHSKGATSLLLAHVASATPEERTALTGRPQGSTPSRSTDHAASFSVIWAYEPILFPTPASEPQHDYGLASGARKRRSIWSSRDEAYDSYASRPPLSVMTPESLRAYVDHGFADRPDGSVELKCRPEVESQVFAMGAMNTVYSRLGEVDVPVRVVCGEATDAITPAFGSRIVEQLPKGALEVWEGHGHFGPQADPERAAASIRAAAQTAGVV
jgi:pimeloyl-ACP methyl ester carboxylesterase